MMKRVKSLVPVLGAFVIGVLLAYAGMVLYDDDPQGDAGSACDKFPGPSLVSANGMKASSHTTACTTLGTSVVGYIYVHPTAKPPSSEYLVLRYSQGAQGQAPEMKWIDQHHLVLKTDRVTSISKIKTEMNSVSISYDISGPNP